MELLQISAAINILYFNIKILFIGKASLPWRFLHSLYSLRDSSVIKLHTLQGAAGLIGAQLGLAQITIESHATQV